MNALAALAGAAPGIVSGCSAHLALSGAPTLLRHLLASAACNSTACYSSVGGKAAAAVDAAQNLAAFLDSVLLRPGAGEELLKSYPELQGRLTLGSAQAAVHALGSVGASPYQVAGMLRANVCYLVDLDADKFRLVVDEERSQPGSVLGRLIKMEVQHFSVAADGSLHLEEPRGEGDPECQPSLFLETTTALECVFASTEGASTAARAAGPLPPASTSTNTQQFQRWVEAWLEVGSSVDG